MNIHSKYICFEKFWSRTKALNKNYSSSSDVAFIECEQKVTTQKRGRHLGSGLRCSKTKDRIRQISEMFSLIRLLEKLWSLEYLFFRQYHKNVFILLHFVNKLTILPLPIPYVVFLENFSGTHAKNSTYIYYLNHDLLIKCARKWTFADKP